MPKLRKAFPVTKEKSEKRKNGGGKRVSIGREEERAFLPSFLPSGPQRERERALLGQGSPN